MKINRYKRIEVISENSPMDFQDKLNDLYMKLQGKKFTEQLYNNENGFTAYITFEEIEQTPDCLKDEYELKGITFTCADCPYYEALNNFEGTCDFCRGKLRRTDEACNVYWRYMEEKEMEGMYQDLKDEIKRQYGTMSKFAAKLEIQQGYLSRMLHGKSPFSLNNQLKILKALGIEITEGNLNKYFKENTK